LSEQKRRVGQSNKTRIKRYFSRLFQFAGRANIETMNLKQSAGEKAVEFVQDEMIIGLGTGSTVYWTIRRLGALVRDGLKIRAVPTSANTENLCRESGVPLTDFSEVEQLDLTIDGADEISPELDLIKGGGGALLREKLVAAASKRLIIVADESKLVTNLGAFPLPVEVVPFGWQTTARRVENLNLKATMRLSGEKPFITDNGNYILDCVCSKIENPAELHRKLKLLTGVVETGLFTGMANSAVIAGASGIEIIERDLKT
jgi:ribose 5-phosphate isomerase A